jgi:hypothetical protein
MFEERERQLAKDAKTKKKKKKYRG